MPKLQSESFGGGDQSWLGSAHGIGNCRTGTLDVSAFTKATHYPNGYIPSGTPVDVADEGAIKPYADAAGARLGFLFTDQATDGSTDIPAPIFRHGIVKVDNLPGNFTIPATGSAAGFVFVGGN